MNEKNARVILALAFSRTAADILGGGELLNICCSL